MNTLYKDLIYLLSCAVNGITPNRSRVQAMDLERLYRLAKFHTVRAAVCIALKRARVQDKEFDQAYKKSVRKNITIPAWLNAYGEAHQVNFSKVLQEALLSMTQKKHS